MFLVNNERKLNKLFNRTNFYCLTLTKTDCFNHAGEKKYFDRNHQEENKHPCSRIILNFDPCKK